MIQHPGLSEVYFPAGVLPIGGIAVSWAMAEFVGERWSAGRPVRSAWWALVVGVVVASAVAAGIIARRGAPAPTTRHAAIVLLKWALATSVVALLVVGVVAWLAGRVARRQGFAGMGPVTALSALLGLLVATMFVQLAAPPPRLAAKSTPASRAEAAAGEWISQHTDRFALFATNDHCVVQESDVCMSRQWWISGLGGRRVMVEGWSYIPGSTGRRPFADEEILRRNQAAFSAAAPADLAWMKAQGVQYMVAVQGGGDTVSPHLFDETTTVFRDGPIRIVRLR